jgi:hypothetical protein
MDDSSVEPAVFDRGSDGYRQLLGMAYRTRSRLHYTLNQLRRQLASGCVAA